MSTCERSTDDATGARCLASRSWQSPAGPHGRPRALDGQPTAIIIRETQPASTKLTPQKPILFDQVPDGLPLRVVQQPVNTISTIFNAAGSITSRSLYHGGSRGCRPTCGTLRVRAHGIEPNRRHGPEYVVVAHR